MEVMQESRAPELRSGALGLLPLGLAVLLAVSCERSGESAIAARDEAPPVSLGFPPAPIPAAVPGTESAGDFAPLASVPPEWISDGSWEPMGPGPVLGGQARTQGNQVAGAIQTLAPHPEDPNILFVGTVNGGIWRTDDALADAPSWRPLTDSMPSLSIGALAFDARDPDVIVAGIGRFSSFGRVGGPLTGLLRSADGGETWSAIAPDVLRGQSIVAVLSRGRLILAASPARGGGLFRSSDAGASFAAVSGAPGSGLPEGAVFHMIGDPSSPDRVYAAVAGTGIFQSDDLGASWTEITQGDASGLAEEIRAATLGRGNVELATAQNGRLYVAVLPQGRPSYIGYRDAGVREFVRMDVPTYPRGDETVGTNPGGQGLIHFFIEAFPQDPQTVVVGGDLSVGRFVGAGVADGNINRGDTRRPRGGDGARISPQWEHMAHSIIAALPEGGTRGGTAPHADSRDAAFDARGDLIVVDDGGVYRRTRPLDNQGDWTALMGNLQITEFHDLAYDTVADTLVGGTQDNGAVSQRTPRDPLWVVVASGDGGDVDVDDRSIPGRSLRYVSSQNLAGLRRILTDASGASLGARGVARNVVEGEPLRPQFITPLRIHAIDGTRLILGAANAVYESLDRGDNLRAVPGMAGGINREVTPVYGHRDDPNLIVVALGNRVLARRGADPELRPTAAPFPGGRLLDLAQDPADVRTLYALDAMQLFRTRDAGESWEEIGSNLSEFSPAPLVSLEYVPSARGDRIVVGTNAGVFFAEVQHVDRFARLGSGLPNSLVLELDYDAQDDVLVAAPLGRGAFLLRDVSQRSAPAMAAASDPFRGEQR